MHPLIISHSYEQFAATTSNNLSSKYYQHLARLKRTYNTYLQHAKALKHSQLVEPNLPRAAQMFRTILQVLKTCFRLKSFDSPSDVTLLAFPEPFFFSPTEATCS